MSGRIPKAKARRDSLPGLGLVAGAGIGLIVGVLIGGGGAIALGTAIGGGLGLVAGAAARALWGSSGDG
jgi:hypothetical protein